MNYLCVDSPGSILERFSMYLFIFLKNLIFLFSILKIIIVRAIFYQKNPSENVELKSKRFERNSSFIILRNVKTSY